MKDPVRGTLQVTACSGPSNRALSANYFLTGVVTAPGLTPTAVERHGIARTSKWPWPGQRLPVTVDRADPRRLRIDWDEVEPTRTAARRTAEKFAEAQRSGEPTTTSAPGTGAPTHTVTTSTTIDASHVPGLQAEILRISESTAHDPALMHLLINAKLVERGVLQPDGSPGPAATARVTSSEGQAGTQRVNPAQRLRDLEKLRNDGLISNAEYERLRMQILTDL